MLDCGAMRLRALPLLRRVAMVSLLSLIATLPAQAQEGWQFGTEGIQLRQGRFRLRMGGYIQGDFRSYHDWDAGDEDTGELRSDSAELRRLRLGLEARYRGVTFEVDADPQDEGDELKDLLLAFDLGRGFDMQVGHMKVPLSFEFLTSAARTDFVERSLLSTHIGPSRDWGLMVSADRGPLLAQAGRTRQDRSETTGVLRVVVEAVKGLSVGGSASIAQVEAEAAGPGLDPEPKGILGEGPSGFEFYDRHFVNGQRLRAGAEAVFRRGPVGLSAEWMRAREEREEQGSVLDDLPPQLATGWYAGGTWLLTGEKKDNSIRPRRPFPGGPGAIEIGARFERLRFDDDGENVGFEGAGNRARNIRPASDRVFTGGLSWWPVFWLRFMGNVLVERFQDPLLAPEPGRTGNYVTFVARMQMTLR
jgi:phosphate-selective porin